MATIKPVRVAKTKYGTYSLQFTSPDGRRRRLSVGSQQQAQRTAVKFTDWLLDGKDPEQEMERAKKEALAKAVTLRDFFPVFYEKHGSQQSENTRQSYSYSFKNICRCPVLADAPIGTISIAMLKDYQLERVKLDRATPATANREAALVTKMLSYAVERSLLSFSPLRGFKMLKEAPKRRVRLSGEQILALLNELTLPLANVVEFAVYQGFRKENILSLRIEQIRFHDLTETGEVDLVVKGGRLETKTLGRPAVKLLKRVIGDRNEGYVFLNPKTETRWVSIHKTFNAAVRKLGLTTERGSKITFHDLRHVFGTWLRDAGVSLDDIRPLMGHKDRKMTDHYITEDRFAVGQQLDKIPMLRAQ